MQALMHEAADMTAASPNWKDRVAAAARVFDLQWARAKAFYYGDARRVEAGEMDYARRAIAKLRKQRERQKALAHIAWMRAALEQNSPLAAGVRGEDVLRTVHALDEMEQVVGCSGAEDGAVDVPGER